LASLLWQERAGGKGDSASVGIHRQGNLVVWSTMTKAAGKKKTGHTGPAKSNREV